MNNRDRASETRQRLVSATVELLLERGYHRVTFVEVAKRSGLSRGAVHHHFSSIPELMLAVVQYIEKEITASVVREFSGLTLDKTALENSVDLLWGQLQSTMFRVYLRIRSALETDDGLAEVVRPAMADATNRWTAMLGEVMSPGDAVHNAQLSRIVLTALAGAATTNASLGPPPTDPDRTEFRRSLKRLIAASR